MQIGIYTFVERTPDPASGALVDPVTRIADLMEEVALADQVGLDVFGIGEHHRTEYLASAPAVLLAGAATRTRRIRLTSAVTVLSSADPVRVFQEFATLDLLSGGRAEITAGRGSFIESFPLFGHDLDDYETLFSEKLALLQQLRGSETVNWQGRHRAPLEGQGVYPRPVQDPLPLWVAVGGSPQSVVRAGTLGLPLALAIIGGEPERFAPLVALYREAGARAGHDPAVLKVSINVHGLVADTARGAADLFYPPLAQVMDTLGRERGWPPLSRAAYERQVALKGALLVGDPQAVIDKILYQHAFFRHDRFMMQMTVGTLPHREVMRAIELLGTVVAPAVRAATAGGSAAAAA